MKVLILTNSFPKFSETFIRDQIVQLLSKNIEVSIFTRDIDNKELESLNGLDEYAIMERVFTLDNLLPRGLFIRLLTCGFIVVKSLFSGFLLNFFKIIFSNSKKGFNRKIEDIFLLDYMRKNKIDVIHAHFGNNGERFAVFQEFGLKLITTFHGYDIRESLANGKSAYPNLFNSDSLLIAISDYNYDSLASLGVSEDRLIQIGNGVNTQFFKQRDGFLSNGVIRLITVARLVPEKALHLAIKSIAMLLKGSPELRLEYIIIGEGSLRGDLEKLITSLSLKNTIRLLGAKDSHFVRNSLLESDVLLLPSISEALPTIILEAQSCGVPVLATDVGSVKNMVKGGLVVKPNSVTTFTQGLKELIKNRENWVSIGAKGRKHVEKEHSLNNQIERLIEVYQSHN